MPPPRLSTRKQADQAPRYREAAELAIEQLDWCITYLRRIDKAKIASALEHNRNAIVERTRHRAAAR